jgi:hypothetical protein
MAQPTFHLASRRREGAQRKAGERSRAPGALAAGHPAGPSRATSCTPHRSNEAAHCAGGQRRASAIHSRKASPCVKVSKTVRGR